MARRRTKRPWGYDSRGTPGVLMLPGCLLLILLCTLPLLVPDLMQRCIGHSIAMPRGGKAGAAFLLAEIACSPLLLLGPGREIALALTIIAPLAALAWVRHWTNRHQAHWDIIRAKERERRAEKRRLTSAENQEGEPPAGRG